MPDLRFFDRHEAITVGHAVDLTDAELVSGGGGGTISSVADLHANDKIAAALYCNDGNKLGALRSVAFGLCFVPPKLKDDAPTGGAVAVCSSPRLAFAQVAAALFQSKPLGERQKRFSKNASVDETAWISASATLGDGVVIGPHVTIGPGVQIGARSEIGAGATITHALIGEDVAILPGAQIGQAGFGFEPTATGLERVPQLGRVVIGNSVEIGANSTIDRGALLDTEIGEGTKIDNLVQIGHNVIIGRSCVIAAQTGISGSCVIEDGVFMGGKVGLADHLTIGAGAMIAAGSGLMRDVPAGEKWGGRPARPVKEWLKETATLTRLANNKSGRK